MVLLCCLLFPLPRAGAEETPAASTAPAEAARAGTGEKIKLFSFNIQVFGAAKMAREEVVRILADIVSQADLAAIQEVRSAKEDPVLQFMALLPERYAYHLGPREGRTSSKEQYWIIYDREKFTLLDAASWEDPQDQFERNPLAVFLRTAGSFDFILINNHIQPAAAAGEIAALPEVAAYYRELWDEPDVIILGDLNADGQYYDEGLLTAVFPDEAYRVLIPNDADTTVAGSANAYDRFIITRSALEDFAGQAGVLRFDEVYDLEAAGIAPREVSDHYPIWAEFFIDQDTE